ncbi:MAG: ABC transporter substrate-binding protein [Myxococcota bacterium]
MRLIRRSSAALAALALLAGCPEAPQGPRYVGAGASPRSGGVLNISHETDVDGLDPQVAYNELSTMVMRLMFDGLLDYDHNAELIPHLARALPVVSEDGKTFTFHLREGVYFHPMEGLPEGRELIAEDVRYTMLRLMSPELGSPGYGFYNTIVGAEAYHAGEADDVPGIRVTGPYSISFTLERRDQTFLNAMAMTFAYPVPRENVERWGPEVARHPVGTGPNVFERWERGVVIEMRRFDRHFEQRPRPDRVVFYENLPRGTAAMRFRNGGLDTIHRQSQQDYHFFKNAEAWQPYLDEHPKSNVWGVGMNTQVAPLDNVHLRRAIAFALDREGWDRARADRLSPTGQLVPRNVWGYAEGIEDEHTLNLERARQEMALAGYADGYPEPLSFIITEGDVGRIYGELVQADLARIGVEVRIRQVAFSTYLSETGTRGRAELFMVGWDMDFPDAANFFEPLFHSDAIADTGSQNRAFYSNPALDAILDQARGVVDRSERRDLYRQASRILIDDAPWGFVFSDTLLEVWQPYVRGYRPHPVWPQNYRDAWLDLPRRRAGAAR